MRHFEKLISLAVAGMMVSVAGSVTTARAAEITPTSDITLTNPSAFLGISSLATTYYGGALNTYAVPFAGIVSLGGSLDAPPTALPIPGYVGSSTITFGVTTGAVNQVVSWGTTNGAPIDPLSDVPNLIPGDPFAGQGNAQSNGGSIFGYTGSVTDPLSSFGANGTWDASIGAFIGVNNDSNNPSGNGAVDSIFLYFTQPIAGFSALFNYDPTNGTNPTLTALAGDGTTITGAGANTTSINTAPATTTNGGIIYGFLDNTNDIQVIQLTDGYAALAGLVVSYANDLAQTQTSPTAVPEPVTLALLGSGLFGLGLVRRRRAK